MRKKYPSDITREQFEDIRPLLESGRKKTAPRKVDLYEVFCAVLYLLKSLAFEQNKEELTEVKGILCDGGYSGHTFADAVKSLLGEQVDVQIVKRNEMHTFKVIPKRWVVERSFAWLEKQRRLWKNCERKHNTAPQFMILTFISILISRL